MEELKENIPLTKEEARDQFNRITKELNIKHTFSFDEMYDLLLERRIEKERQEKFQKTITTFEKGICSMPGTLVGNVFPLEHTFGEGTYIRKLNVPGDVLTVTKIHAVTHPFFLMKGSISIYSDKGITHHHAPYHGITLAGTKRIIYHHNDVEFITVHPNPDNEHDIEKIENRVTVKTFDEVPYDGAKIIELIKKSSEEI